MSLDDLLDCRPEWRERVVFVASVYPLHARRGRALDQDEVEQLVAWSSSAGRPGGRRSSTTPATTTPWSPCCAADVLLVNPIRDGLNLVARRRHRQQAGRCAVPVPRGGRVGRGGLGGGRCMPYDVAGTADALDQALRMPCEGKRGACASWWHPGRMAGAGQVRAAEGRPARCGGDPGGAAGRPHGRDRRPAGRRDHQLGATSGPATATRTVDARGWPAGRGHRRRAGRRGRRRRRRPTAPRGCSSAVPLSAAMGGCSSTDILAGLGHQARAGLGLGPRRHGRERARGWGR